MIIVEKIRYHQHNKENNTVLSLNQNGHFKRLADKRPNFKPKLNIIHRAFRLSISKVVPMYILADFY